MPKQLRYEVFTRLIQLSYLWTVQKPDSKNCDINYQTIRFLVNALRIMALEKLKTTNKKGLKNFC